MTPLDFFIGWSPDTPKPDRRFVLAGGLALVTGGAALAGALAGRQRPPGPGQWQMSDVRTWTGIATAEPYAMLRTADLDGTPRTVLLGCQGKCGVAARIGSHNGQPVAIRGSLIQRGRHAMIAVSEGMDWIAPASSPLTPGLNFPATAPLGEVTLRGEIVDSKCWFGAMRPAEGKVHKACAALCIQGGLPPAFLARDRAHQSTLLIMTDADGAHGPDLLPYVADPVEITAVAKRWGNLLMLDGSVSAIRRL